MEVPKNGCFVRENPTYKWMITGVPLFQKTHSNTIFPTLKHHFPHIKTPFPHIKTTIFGRSKKPAPPQQRRPLRTVHTTGPRRRHSASPGNRGAPGRGWEGHELGSWRPGQNGWFRGWVVGVALDHHHPLAKRCSMMFPYRPSSYWGTPFFLGNPHWIGKIGRLNMVKPHEIMIECNGYSEAVSNKYLACSKMHHHV